MMIGYAFFFMAYTLIPIKKDFPLYVYLLLFLTISALSVCLFYYVSEAVMYVENRFKKAIKNIFSHIYDTKNDIKEEKQAEHEILRGKLIQETIENVG